MSLMMIYHVTTYLFSFYNISDVMCWIQPVMNITDRYKPTTNGGSIFNHYANCE